MFRPSVNAVLVQLTVQIPFSNDQDYTIMTVMFEILAKREKCVLKRNSSFTVLKNFSCAEFGSDTGLGGIWPHPQKNHRGSHLVVLMGIYPNCKSKPFFLLLLSLCKIS